jgi:exosome complex component RRP42
MIESDPQLIRDVVERGKRIDNRKFDDYREIRIEKNAIYTADGSARVKIGNTEVVAGVKFELGTPFSDTPDEGVLIVAAEFVPLASPEFEAGPPGEDAVEVSRVVDRAIRESKVIDFKKLCITPKEKVWMLYVDIDVLDDDGNLIDASSLASVAALMTAKIPDLDENGDIIREKKGAQQLEMTGLPLSTTIVKISNKLLVDPNLSEAQAMDARVTVGTFGKDGQTCLCSMQKGGFVGITTEEIDKILDMAIRKGDELRKLLE